MLITQENGDEISFSSAPAHPHPQFMFSLLLFSIFSLSTVLLSIKLVIFYVSHVKNIENCTCWFVGRSCSQDTANDNSANQQNTQEAKWNGESLLAIPWTSCKLQGKTFS